jgi:hypothetical protein
MKKLILISTCILALQAKAQTGPEITSWILNTTGATGYAGIESNVQQVQYSSNYVYVSATCIPGYSIGPWIGSPAIPSNQNFVFQISRHPQPNTGTPKKIGLGHIGILTNGVSIFNALDAHSYNNANIWFQNGYHFEYPSFDACLGHPQQFGEYHHHVSPNCLYNHYDSTHHSPIIGYAFDGYPIYGAWAYTDTNGTSPIKRMVSSYHLRSITNRTTLPDGTILTPTQYGPAVSDSFPLGSYLQDFEYIAGSGDLDDHNGRWCKTPEYPAGTYCYFVTLDASLQPAYPYTLGLTYYGVVNPVDIDSPGYFSGHVIISEPVTTYTSSVAEINSSTFSVDLYPAPSGDYMHFFIQPIASNNFTATLTNMAGKTVLSMTQVQPTISYTMDISKLAPGNYIFNLNNSVVNYTRKVTIER